MRNKFTSLLFFILYTSYFILITSPLYAANPNVSVFPTIIKLDLIKDPAQTEITYTNNTNTPLELSLSASDFSPIGDSGQYKFIQDDQNQISYSLSNWLSFEKNILQLAPHSTEKVKVFIEKNKLPLGGHYASILASYHLGSETSQIKLNTILSSLLFVRAPSGNEIYEAQLETFALQKNFLSLPQSVEIKLQNTGNSDLTPHGKVDLLNSYNEIVAQAILNPTSLMILPNSLRRLDTGFVKIKAFSPPGFYTAKLTLGYGPKDSQITREETFFSLGTHPLLYFTPLVLILLILSFRKLRRKSA